MSTQEKIPGGEVTPTKDQFSDQTSDQLLVENSAGRALSKGASNPPVRQLSTDSSLRAVLFADYDDSGGDGSDASVLAFTEQVKKNRQRFIMQAPEIAAKLSKKPSFKVWMGRIQRDLLAINRNDDRLRDVELAKIRAAARCRS